MGRLRNLIDRVDQIDPSLFDPNYVMRRARAQMTREWIGRLNREFRDEPPPIRVLDVGGRTAPYRVFGNERNEWTVMDVEPYRPDTVVGDAHNMPFPDGHFHIVLCTQVFEYFEDPMKAAQEIHRVLRPGGTAIISNPACFPSYGDASLRIMPRGWKLLLGDYSSVEVDVECNTVSSFFRTLNVYLDILLQSTILHMPFRLTICPVLNLMGWFSRKRFRDTGFVANYFVTARK